LLASASMSGRTEPLAIIAPAPVQTFIETAINTSDSSMGYQLQFFDVAESDFCWEDDAVKVTATALSHRVPCFAYVVTEKRLDKHPQTTDWMCERIRSPHDHQALHSLQDLHTHAATDMRSDHSATVPREPRPISDVKQSIAHGSLHLPHLRAH